MFLYLKDFDNFSAFDVADEDALWREPQRRARVLPEHERLGERDVLCGGERGKARVLGFLGAHARGERLEALVERLDVVGAEAHLLIAGVRLLQDGLALRDAPAMLRSLQQRQESNKGSTASSENRTQAGVVVARDVALPAFVQVR